MLKFTTARDYNLDSILLRKIPGKKKWIVEEDFVFYIDYENQDGKIIVPKGFITDFGSIPRFLWIFFDPTKYISYVIHDYLYSKDSVIIWNKQQGEKRSRKYDDSILVLCMNIEGSRVLEKLFVYLGVRIGGFLAYKH